MSGDIVEHIGDTAGGLQLRGSGGPIVVTGEDVRQLVESGKAVVQAAGPIVTGIHRGIKRGYQAAIDSLNYAIESAKKSGVRSVDMLDEMELDEIVPGDQVIVDHTMPMVPRTTGGTGGVVRWTSSRTSRLVSSTTPMTTSRGGMPTTSSYLNGPTGTPSSMRSRLRAQTKLTIFQVYHCDPFQEEWLNQRRTDQPARIVPGCVEGTGPALRWALERQTSGVIFEHPEVLNSSFDNAFQPQFSGLVFNVQWPGSAMHDDPTTITGVAPTATTDGTSYKFRRWAQLTSGVNKKIAVPFSTIMTDQQWTKMVVYKVNLEMFMRNHYVGPVHVHVIFYQHKRKGMTYGEELGQWWNNETNYPMNAYTIENFARFNRLLIKANCKIVKKDFFVIQGLSHNETFNDGSKVQQGAQPAATDPDAVKVFAHDGPNLHRLSYTFNQKHVLSRDTMRPGDLVTNQDTWFQSTAVREESMIHCAMYATPVGVRKIVTLNSKESYNNVENMDTESNDQYPTTAGNYNMQGVEVLLTRKVHLKVDKDITF